MTQYRLHYAGSTFDLRDEDEAERVLAAVRNLGMEAAGGILTVNLVEGALQLLLSRYVSLAVSTVTPEDDAAASVYEAREPLVI